MKKESRLGKKLTAAAMAAVLAMSLNPAAAFAAPLAAGDSTGEAVQAVDVQTSKTLADRGVKFNLKNGKSFTAKKYMRAVGNRAVTVKLSGLKVSKAPKEGFKQATFTMTWKLKKALTGKQGKKVLKAFKKAYENQGGDQGNASSVVWSIWMSGASRYHVVDYVTGENLEDPDNSVGVTYTNNWTSSKVKTYKGSDGWWFTDPGVMKCKVTLTFPEDYKNLCVGIGTDTFPRSSWTKADASFEGESYYLKGKKIKYGVKAYSSKYWQTSWFKKQKADYRFIRIK